MEQGSLTLDANSRWVHAVNDTVGCYDPFRKMWNMTICSDPKKCSEHCAVDGVNLDAYANTYGVALAPRGVELKYVDRAEPRVYMLDPDESYKIFKLKNREFAFDVDVSKLPAGLNGAVYFVEMKRDGGLGDTNKAGSKYGMGYCDAQCPRELRFIGNTANVINWDSATGSGNFGSCCTEMDVWEANRAASALSMHPCKGNGPTVCSGVDCGDGDKRYEGQCDKDGCIFNNDQMGAPGFFGAGPNFRIDTTKPLTVVTQWWTDDRTDLGVLSEIRRIYMQGDQIIYNWNASTLGAASDNKITDHLCSAQKKVSGAVNDFAAKGGLKSLSQSLDRGMVLVLSLWIDPTGWLTGDAASKKPDFSQFTGASVQFSNFMYGEISSAEKYRLAKQDSTNKATEEIVNKRSRVGPIREIQANGFQNRQHMATIVVGSAMCVSLGALLAARIGMLPRFRGLAYSALLPRGPQDAFSASLPVMVEAEAA